MDKKDIHAIRSRGNLRPGRSAVKPSRLLELCNVGSSPLSILFGLSGYPELGENGSEPLGNSF